MKTNKGFEPAPKPEHISSAEWQSWQWQFKNRLSSRDDFQRVFNLSAEELDAFQGNSRLFKIQVTPYYAALVADQSFEDPIRKMIVPSPLEQVAGAQQMPDPLGEGRHQATERLIHRYPDRVLFLITDTCSVYCRYCLRKHFTGQDEAFIPPQSYQKALNYIRDHSEIREVILSGGDPLTLSDQRLEQVIQDVRAIEHIDLVRIGTRMPVVCPMRITDELVQRLKKLHPIYIMTHFNHPREVTSDAAEALTRLVDNGFPVFNQLVLLKGVNDDPEVVEALSRRLLRLRVKPYYMFQCDPSMGTDHFRISIEESMRIQRKLWGRISGLAMPNLSLDIPGGGGKVGFVPDFVVAKDTNRWRFRGWDGIEADYVNPKATD